MRAFIQFLTSVLDGGLRCAQSQLELGPIIFRAQQFQIAAMQTRKLARQIQSESVPGNGAASNRATEPLENVFLRIGWDSLPAIANADTDFVLLGAGWDSHLASFAIVLSRVLEDGVH